MLIFFRPLLFSLFLTLFTGSIIPVYADAPVYTDDRAEEGPFLDTSPARPIPAEPVQIDTDLDQEPVSGTAPQQPDLNALMAQASQAQQE